ncbi:MAG TPA: archease [Candidatus Dormibacteraeota bacterium]|nr:archease [Candidatus Dormibacteraeota bacterium]
MARAELTAEATPPGVTFREHTADVIMEVTGPTLESCLARAGAGLFAVFAPPPTAEALTAYEIRVEGSSPEELLVAWLEELLYRGEVEGVVFTTFEVELQPEADGVLVLVARVGGRRLRPEDEPGGPSVKAVTRHQLRLGPGGEGWLARVVLDV